MPLDKIGRVVIIAGSDSDKEHIDKIAQSLDSYGLGYEVHICSAHKQPVACADLIHRLNEETSPLVVIAVAGGTDALSGTLSWELYHPVISCPPDGIANQSPLNNPKGSSNATIYNPENVGRFVAQIYASSHPIVQAALLLGIEKKCDELSKADIKIREAYARSSRGGTS